MSDHEAYIPRSRSERKKVDQFIDQLDVEFEVRQDPVMHRVIEEARAASDIMKIVPSTQEEQMQVLGDLDQQWMRWYYKKFVVSGMLRFVDAFSGDDTVRTYDKPVDDVVVTSYGFNIAPIEWTDPHAADREEPLRLGEVIFNFSMPLSKARRLFTGSQYIAAHQTADPEIILTAKLDGIQLDSSEATAERAIRWLEYTYPALVAEIDTCILPQMSHEQMILALRGFDFASFVDLSDQLTANCITEYLNALIVIDEEAPYELTATGYVSIGAETENTVGTPVEVQDERAYGKVSPLHFTSVFDVAGDDGPAQSKVLAFDLEYLPNDPGGLVRDFCIPIDSVTTLESTRSRFYTTR